MNPNDFNPDQNPFEAILAQKQGGAPAQAIPPQTMMEGMAKASGTKPGMSPQMGQGMQPEIIGPDEVQPGKTGDNTKPLLMAVQALHNYIAASTDPGTIRLVRNLISALTQLVARDQKAGEELAQQQEQQMSQMQQGGQEESYED